MRSVLGSGSMGTVWSAYDEFLHRPVAVKEMKVPPGIPAEQADELRERTLREARAIAVLSHPNVITLHDVARENDAPFVVMELLPSRSLAHLLRDHGPLTVEQAAAVGIAVAAALEAAHDAGITHRDVKPGNVLVASDGRIKLTDFGIARNVSEATMTRTGIMLGSPAYISPEVASGGAVTPNADLWGLGATLFAAVEGAPPYDADGDPLETVGKVVNGKVPRPKPGPLADVIAALMKKEPEKRISLREVRHRLYPKQTKATVDLFGPELFHTPDGKKTAAHLDATDTQVIKTVAPKPDSPEQPAALAADPGPLPFMRSGNTGSAPAFTPAPPLPTPPPLPAPLPPPPPRRGGRATAMLTVASLVLFALACGGGFALARVVSGQNLLPPQGPAVGGLAAPGTVAESSQPLNLIPQQANASSTANVTRDSEYTLSVPEGWKRFIASRKSVFGTSTVVQYISPDGRQSLRLERIPNFYEKYSLGDAMAALRSSGSQDSFNFTRDPAQTANGTEVMFRAVERAQSNATAITRATFALVKQSDNTLWLLSLTVPAEQEDTAANTFSQIAPTLSFPATS
ncbi:serine/threonine protein kinase [Amycolatopsis rubida]|uniref:non-specific serine/threonine protein kinase n=2 Tax=Pseudonocardiaceae TaxID=2070 RepID=A0ABX0BL58_9PSEU|nr:serine/threonine-protein kinase [Amycolatopsis rubida]NEC54213.1 serine/threonine protein kinase [Amycolatopsis rubida]